ncbi:MAG TPA: DUF2085 domain-containing protein [Anaerolineales bacterium]|nr:DUF2085 domain-containing protein [Anaerolineales bacterium]HRF49542.1 DUF2085 domain-containing protein [Anaerolineales bacterium]
MPLEQTPDGKLRATGDARKAVIGIDRWFYRLARHWLAVINFFVFIYVGLPFLAPVLMYAGQDRAARIIYTLYSPLCHQLASRSWFLFGEQAAYPKDQFIARTGIDLDSTPGMLQARAFVGDATFGFKTAFCQRDIAIYGAILVVGLLYAVPAVQRWLKPMPVWLWVVLGLGPIALDGFSQLFSSYPYTAIPVISDIFAFLPERESTPELRTLTGLIFGASCAWLAFPYLRESFTEMKDQLAEKLTRVAAQG